MGVEEDGVAVDLAVVFTWRCILLGRYINLNITSTEEVDNIVTLLIKRERITHVRQKKKRCYEIVIANALASKEYGVIYQRSTSGSQHYPPSNKYSMDSRTIISVVDNLAKHGYLNNFIASRDTRSWNRKKERSHYFPTNKLLDLFSEECIILTKKCFYNTHEGIIMRDKNKYEVPYVDTPELSYMRIVVNKLNALNEGSLFTHDGKIICGGGIVRIFNEDFERGGRWYRCSAQNIRQKDSSGNPLPLKQTRLGIEIDGNPVVEVDYSNLHPMLLCALYGFPVERFYGDLYKWLLPEDCSHTDRGLFKVALNIMFNSLSKKDAVGAIRNEMNGTSYSGVYAGKAEEVFDRIYSMLPEFEPFFCNENCTGMFLQNKDAAITEKIVMGFVNEQVPILPIHDSFIVEEQYLVMLLESMESAFREVTSSYTWEVAVKVNYCDGAKESVLLGKMLDV